MNKSLLQSIFKLFKEYKLSTLRVFFILLLTGFFESVSLALLPLSLSLFVNENAINNLPIIVTRIFNNNSSQSVGLYLSIFIIFSFLFKNILGILSAKYTTRFSCLLKDNWRIEILDNYINLNISQINDTPTGLVIENTITQVENAAKFIKTIIKTFSYLIISISLVISLFITSFKITLITGILFILIGLITSFPIKNISSKIGRKTLKYRQLISKNLSDYFIGILQVKIFNLENTLKENINTHSKLQSKYSENSAIISQIPSFIGALALVIIIIAVFISSLNKGDLNITQVATFILIAQKLQIYVGNLLQSYSSLRLQKASFDLVYNLLNKNNVKDHSYKESKKSNEIKLKKINSLKFENVSFSYVNKKSILKGINFSLGKGDIFYICGESGSGKSTIVNLLCGLLKQTTGQIKINDYPLDMVKTSDFLSRISYVSQDNFLFNDSIINNLSLGKNNFEKNWIIECCKLAGAHKFITNLPNGYQTNVGERGLSLSGGQIQRICIARAFIRNGDLMIFDEATSALDKRNEQKIFDVFKKLSESGKIIIIISHNLKTNQKGLNNLILQK